MWNLSPERNSAAPTSYCTTMTNLLSSTAHALASKHDLRKITGWPKIQVSDWNLKIKTFFVPPLSSSYSCWSFELLQNLCFVLQVPLLPLTHKSASEGWCLLLHNIILLLSVIKKLLPEPQNIEHTPLINCLTHSRLLHAFKFNRW